MRARLEKVTVSGNVELNATLVGSDSGIIALSHLSIVGWWASAGQVNYNFNLNKPIKGAGTYTAEYGSNLYIDVINTKNGQTRSFDLPLANSISDRSANADETLIFNAVETIDMTSNA